MAARTFEEIKARLDINGFGAVGSVQYTQILTSLEYAYNAPSTSQLNFIELWNAFLDKNPN
jgi:hypothetical protein